MKYIVKEFDGDDKLRYAVIETLKYSGLRKDFSDIYHGIILVVDNKEDAETISYILNKNYYGLKEMNFRMMNKNSFKIGDIVEIVNREHKLGFVEEVLGEHHCLVHAVDKYGNYTGVKYYLHKNEMRHQF